MLVEIRQIELMKQLKVIISGGGTGGHIFPALAIAKELENQYSNVEILFVGAKGRMEMDKIPAEGYPIKGLWISGLQRTWSWQNLSFPLKVIDSLIQAGKILKEFKPDIAIGTGGYASGPLLFMAAKKAIPTLIQEQNSYPGITNKILAKKVSRICVAYSGMERFFPKNKIVFTGNPIRKEVIDFQGKTIQAKEKFALNKQNKTILVIGGSLGARTINLAIAKNIRFFVENKLNLIWQTGILFQQQAQHTIKNTASDLVQAHTFIKDMDMAYAAADIIISRSGAIAISELCCVGKPTILIPSPNVAEDHQTKNAQAIVEKSAALLVADKEAETKLVDCLSDLLHDEEKQKQLAENIKKLAILNATENIVNQVNLLLNK